MAASRILVAPESCLNLAVSSDASTSTNNTEPAPGRQRTTLSTRAFLRLLSVLLLGGLAQSTLQAQTASFSSAVTTLGGGFNNPAGVAVDASGNVYVADIENNAVYEVPPGCTSVSCVKTLGGGFNGPQGVAVDASGNVYVADTNNIVVKEIRQGCVPSNCVITDLPSHAGFPPPPRGRPNGVTVDGAGNVYVASGQFVYEIPSGCASSSCVIVLGGGFLSGLYGLAVDSSGNIDVANVNQGVYRIPPGCTVAEYNDDNCTITQMGPNFNFPYDVALDASGNIYVAADGVYEMPANCTSAAYANSDCTITTLGGGFGVPTEGVAVDASGNVYVGNTIQSKVQEIQRQGVNFGAVAVGTSGPVATLYFNFTAADTVTTSMLTQGAAGLDFVDAESGSCDPNGSTYASSAGSSCTVDVIFSPKYAGARYGAVVLSDASGVIATAYIYGTGTGPLVALTPGIITTVAGNGTQGYSGDGGAATSAELSFPYGVPVDASGNIYIADSFNNRIRKVSPNGIITTVAGNGTQGYSRDGGAATSAELGQPFGVAVDGSGNIYIADVVNNRIRMVTASTGIITTVAGNGTLGSSGDGGAATSAELLDPTGVALDGSGNLYIADRANDRIRKVTASTGIITTVAGNGTQGYSGDGGAATSAELSGPFAVTVDASGNIYIADEYNQRIRKVTVSTGIITTVAGNGTQGYSGDGGAATSAELSNVLSVAVDASGNIYFADTNNNRIREVAVSTGMISTLVGSGTGGYSGDGGAATSAELNQPVGVFVDGSGNLYIADYANGRIRNVNVATAALNFANTNVGSQSSDSPQTVTLQNIGNAPLTFPVPGTGENPSISANFTLDSSTTCPEVMTSSSAGMLAAGATCTLAVDFIPTTAGPISGTAILTDNNLNVVICHANH